VIDDPNLGFRFTAPAGFQVTKSQVLYVLTMGDRDILVAPHKETNMQSLAKTAEEGFIVGEAIQLRPAGQVTMVNQTTLALDLSGTVQGKAARARMLVLMSPNGGGAIILAGGSPAYTREYAPLTETVARSVQWTQPVAQVAQAAPAATAGGATPVGNSPWAARLSNQKLHYFSRYNSGGGSGGYAEHMYMGLCSDGSFFFKGDFSASINVPGANGSVGNRNGNIGRWKVTGQGNNPTLVLTFSDGSQANYVLSTDGEKTFLNNTRWMKEAAPECR
jgi:hypothetical protein